MIRFAEVRSADEYEFWLKAYFALQENCLFFYVEFDSAQSREAFMNDPPEFVQTAECMTREGRSFANVLMPQVLCGRLKRRGPVARHYGILSCQGDISHRMGELEEPEVYLSKLRNALIAYGQQQGIPDVQRLDADQSGTLAIRVMGEDAVIRLKHTRRLFSICDEEPKEFKDLGIEMKMPIVKLKKRE